MRNCKYMSAAEGSAGDGCGTMTATCFYNRVGRQELSQLIICKDGAHPRTTATMRYSEGFVKVKMTDVSSDMSGIGKSDLGIHICPVHINQSAICMDDIRHFSNCGFKHAMG